MSTLLDKKKSFRSIMKQLQNETSLPNRSTQRLYDQKIDHINQTTISPIVQNDWKREWIHLKQLW